MRIRRAWAVALVLLPLLAAAARGQEEVDIPVHGHGRVSILPLDALLAGLFFGAPLFPLVFAWAYLQARRYRAASQWALATLVVAGIPLLLGAWTVFDSLVGTGFRAWDPGAGTLSALTGGAPEEVLFFAPSGIAALLAWWILRTADARLEGMPERPLAGTHASLPQQGRRPGA